MAKESDHPAQKVGVRRQFRDMLEDLAHQLIQTVRIILEPAIYWGAAGLGGWLTLLVFETLLGYYDATPDEVTDTIIPFLKVLVLTVSVVGYVTWLYLSLMSRIENQLGTDQDRGGK